MLELQKLGFTNAYALLGGLMAWQTANYPIEQAPAEPVEPATTTAAPTAPANVAPAAPPTTMAPVKPQR